MTVTTKKIVKQFPILKEEDLINGDVSLKQESLNEFNDTEKTFWYFARFCENPSERSFDFQMAYKSIDKSFIPFFLECIHSFFSNDTYLLDKDSFSFIDKTERLFNQSDFASFLMKFHDFHGKNFSRASLSVYYKRGSLPEADIIINGVAYWYESTCQSYLDFISHDECKFCHSKNYRLLRELDNHNAVSIKCLSCGADYSL